MCSLYSLPPISIKLELLSRRPTRRKPLETPESSQAIIGSWNVPPDAVLPSWSPRKFAAFIITIALLAAGLLAFDLFSGPEVNRLRLPQLPRRDLSTFSLIPRDWPRHDATAVRDANWNLSARVLACAGPQRIALTRVNTASQSTRTA